MSVNKNISLSIITVCLDSEQTIRKTLESIGSQSFSAIEHIVIDGGSTDNTLDIVEKYTDSIRYLISETDKGIYDAMNKGLYRATGDVIYFLNSDDRLCDADVITDVMSEFMHDPDLDLIYGNVIYKYGNDVMERRRFHRVTRRSLIHTDLCHQGVFARRSLFERFGGFDMKYRIAADYDWLLKVFNSGSKVGHINRDIAVFNAGGEHSQDLALSRQERMKVKRNYQNRLHYAVGNTLYRGMRKLRSILGI